MAPNLKASAAHGIMNTTATSASSPTADDPHHRERNPEVASVENSDVVGAGAVLVSEPKNDGAGQKMTANDPDNVPHPSPKMGPQIRHKANTVVETSASTVDTGRWASVGGERDSTSNDDNPRSGTQDTSPGTQEAVDKSVQSNRNCEERKTEDRDTKKDKCKNVSGKKDRKYRASKSTDFSAGEKHNAVYDESESESDYSSESSGGSSSSDFSSSSDSSETTRKEVKVRRKKKTKHSRKPKYSTTEKDQIDTSQQIQELGFQIAQLAQAVQSLQASSQTQQQYPVYVLGAQPQTSFLAAQSTTIPGATSTNSSLPISELNLDISRGSNRGSRRAGGGRNRPTRGHGSQPMLAIVDSNGEAHSSATHSNKKKKVNAKKGTRSDYKRVDWVWNSSLYTWKLQDSAESTSDSRYEDYIFHVRRSFDIEGKFRSTTVDIKSKLLRECLQEVIGDIKGVSLVDESPKTDPNMLFLYLEDIRRHRKKLKQSKAAGDTKKERKKSQRQLEDKRKQLKVLIGYLDKDYAQTKESLYPMLENGLITFELMWALWKPGTLAYTNTYGSTDDPRVFTVELAERHKSFMKGELYHLDGKYFEFDGKKFGHGGVSDEILAFRGARKITSLSCYPLKYHPDEKRLRERLIERGKKFVSLSGVHYKSYTGMAYQKSKKSVIKFNIQQSRVMVDPAIFRRINPNYYISPVKAQEEPIMLGGRYTGEDEDDPCSSESSDDGQTHIIRGRHARKMAAAFLGAASNVNEGQMSFDVKPRSGELGINDSDGARDTQNDLDGIPPTFSDDEYLTASPVVLGFAFSEKQWLEFTVNNIKEIIWNDTAWDSLVSEPETKDLVQALVKSRKFNAANTIDDVIKGKGKGLVTVLHGPPGTGKTLTAEGISELLRCPLYMASAGELGTDSRFLEAELQKMLDICHAWGAILLLDEADVFLEKRNMLDIHRNALVSIFLRQLEYFQGILFLTTNRVETFDEAFQSRIHIALRYGALEPRAKKAIFQMFIDKVRKFGKMKVAEFSEEDLDALARKELNGREIKNVVSSAQDLAVSKEEALGMEHIKQVLDVHAKFGRDLKGGAGFEDAMRSYF